MQVVDATCERCKRPIRWSGGPRVCTVCEPLTAQERETEAAIAKAQEIINHG